MSRTLTLAAAALTVAAVAAGCGGDGSKAAVSVNVTVQSYFSGKQQHAPKRQTRSYSLTCRPTGGTLPYAGRVCADIARHPQPMLNPLPARYGCSGGPNMAVVTVVARANGRPSSFAGNPDCDWPGGVGLAVYYDAATKHSQWLTLTCSPPALTVQAAVFCRSSQVSRTSSGVR